MEKTTQELLEILKSKKDYSQFISEEAGEILFTSVSEYLELILSQKGLKKSEAIQRSNLDKNYAYQLFNGNKTNPSRDKVIMLAFGMSLSLEETNRLLKMCGLAELYVRSLRDSLIIHCLNQGYDLITTNENLHDRKLEILE